MMCKEMVRDMLGMVRDMLGTGCVSGVRGVGLRGSKAWVSELYRL